jgi:hypothetical protein
MRLIAILIALLLSGCTTTDGPTGNSNSNSNSVAVAGGRQWYGFHGAPISQSQAEIDFAGCQREFNDALDMPVEQRDRMLKTGIADIDARTEEAMRLADKDAIKSCMTRHGYLWFRQY